MGNEERRVFKPLLPLAFLLFPFIVVAANLSHLARVLEHLGELSVHDYVDNQRPAGDADVVLPGDTVRIHLGQRALEGQHMISDVRLSVDDIAVYNTSETGHHNDGIMDTTRSLRFNSSHPDEVADVGILSFVMPPNPNLSGRVLPVRYAVTFCHPLIGGSDTFSWACRPLGGSIVVSVGPANQQEIASAMYYRLLFAAVGLWTLPVGLLFWHNRKKEIRWALT